MLRRPPDFFVIGAQRAGTTRLCHLLDRHPSIGIPTKEPFYFQSVDSMIEKRDWYDRLFFEAREPTLGEGSTYYSMAGMYPGTAARIYACNPEARLVYLVRHPLRRIESAWQHLLSVGHISSLRSFKTTAMRSDVLIEPTLYWKQVEEYRSYFPDHQIQVIFFEEFIRTEAETVETCCRFLGVSGQAPEIPVPGVDQNGSAGMEQAWVALDAMRALPGYRRLKRLAPDTMKSSVTSRLRRPVSTRMVWDDELRDYVLDRVASDSARFLRYAGRPEAYWSLNGHSATVAST